MEELFNQIKSAAHQGLYFLALAGALIIPDICGGMSTPGGQTTGPIYKTRFDTHAASRFAGKIDGDTCYRFRCSLLHQGSTQHPASPYSRVLFVEPGDPNLYVHLSKLNGALCIDVQTFSLDMVAAAMVWQGNSIGTEPYDTNVRQFMRRYPDGLKPYIWGSPVIS